MLKTFLALLVVGITSVSAGSISYSLDLGAGTINKNNLTSVVIFETDGVQASLDFPFIVDGHGNQILTHPTAFQPVYSIIVGLDLPSLIAGDNKTHVVFFTNDQFAQDAGGVLFSTVFPNTRHSDFITHLVGAENGDAAQVTWLMNFFTTGDGATARFASKGPSTAVEFTGGTLIASPEPSSVVLIGMGLVVLLVGAAVRRRINARRFASKLAA